MEEGARRYQLLGILGVGGFGTVYHARLEVDGFSKDVAVKLLDETRTGEDDLARFRDEARLLALLRDRAIPTVDPPTRLGGRWALVMELVDGRDLARLLTNGPVPPTVALEIVGEVARALDVAWHHPGPDGQALELLHRDLKPGNLQITPTGQVKVLDFGIARAEYAERESTTTRHIGGTPGYIAPERLHGVERSCGDVYSLGVVLHELVSGALPTTGAAAQTVDFDLDAQGEPDEVGAVIALADEMRAVHADDRPSLREVQDRCEALRATLDGPGLRTWAEQGVPERTYIDPDAMVGATLIHSGTRTLSAMARPRWVLVASLLGALVAVVLLVAALSSTGAPEESARELRPEHRSLVLNPDTRRRLETPSVNRYFHDVSTSPSGEIAWVLTPGEVWLGHVDGRPPRRLDVGHFASQAVFTSDGTLMLLINPVDGPVVLRRVDGDGAVLWEHELERDFWVQPSPVSDQIALSVTDGDGLYLFDPTSQTSQLLAQGFDIILSPAWAPSGEHLAFVGIVNGEWGVYHQEATPPFETSRIDSFQSTAGFRLWGSLLWWTDDTLLSIRRGKSSSEAELVAMTVTDGRVDRTEVVYAFPGSAGHIARVQDTLVAVQGDLSMRVWTSELTEAGLVDPHPVLETGWLVHPFALTASHELLYTKTRNERSYLYLESLVEPGEARLLAEGPWIHAGLWHGDVVYQVPDEPEAEGQSTLYRLGGQGAEELARLDADEVLEPGINPGILTPTMTGKQWRSLDDWQAGAPGWEIDAQSFAVLPSGAARAWSSYADPRTYIQDANGIVVSPDEVFSFANGMVWHPDEQSLVFVGFGNLSCQVLRLSRQGELTTLFDYSGLVFLPVISPDGARVAWTTTDTQSDLWVLGELGAQER